MNALKHANMPLRQVQFSTQLHADGLTLPHLVLTALMSTKASNFQAASTQDSQSTITPFVYCVQQVQNYDRENFVWLGQARRGLRPLLFALHAFNVETALIPDQVSQPTLAQIRFQWWREATDSIRTASVVRHPVIQALSQVLGDSAAPRYRLQRMISTREADILNSMPPNTIADLERYADGTAAQLQALQLESAGVKNSDADHAASHLGKAVGITAILRGTARHATRRRTYLPVELTAKEGVSQEAIYRGEESEGLQNVIFSVASTAKGHLEEARKLHSKLPAEARELMLGAVACGLYLDALEKQNFRIFSPTLQKGAYTPLWHLLKTKYHSVRNTF